MVVIHRRITIIRYNKPTKKDLNEELKFLGDSLGLFGERDKEKSCFRIFIELLKSTRKSLGLSSDEIAAKTKLSRGTVVHHLNRMVEAGLVAADKNRYFLRAGNLKNLIIEIQKDADRTFEDLKETASEIDRGLGL